MNREQLELIQHQLGSITLSDLQDETPEQSETERATYTALIASVWPTLKKDIKRFEAQQLFFTGAEAENWDQVVFGRGTFNGIDLLMQYWNGAYTEHINKTSREGTPDQSTPIGNIEDER